MPHREPDSLPIAVRVYPDGKDDEEQDSGRRKKAPPRPDAMFVFDTETRTDASQRLTFGSYRFIVGEQCLREALFCGDDLPDKDRRVLERYKASHTAATGEEGIRKLDLLTREELIAKVYLNAYKSRCLLVAFNFPFDISRIAYDFRDARRRFAGGFSLGLGSYTDKNSGERADRFRPWISIKQIDSKRAIKGFTGRKKTDREDRIPEGSFSGRSEEDYVFHGHFLDLRTLAFALTDEGYTLEAACKAFGVEHGKQHVTRHGIVTSRYIDYNRNDVLATWELAEKLLEEYDKHPISLQVTKAYSPASIGKAYLRAMGIKPILERQRGFPKEYLGYAQSAFFGGRTSAHIRKTPVPIVYTDFLSMYPTVNSLMDLWKFVTAEQIRVIEHCGDEIWQFLSRLDKNDSFIPETWKYLTAFVQIIPDGGILPSRSKYSLESNDWQVALNYLYGNSTDKPDALWFSLPDIVASFLLTGHMPNIIDAFRLEAVGTLPKLRRTRLRGAIDVDPRQQDFFKVVIEERKRLKSRSDFSQTEKERLDKALKVLANATSYGIYAEMNRQESDQKVNVVCHGIDPTPYTCRVAHPEVPGEYCFPPLASLITGGARLMLALLEKSVSDLGGTYAMEDTDSMAIVATESGGLVPCPGGQYHTKDRHSAVKALSWNEVQSIAGKFAALNPYDRAAIPGSILKIEENNFDPQTGKQRQLYCFAISAKRYSLFLLDENRNPILLRKGVNSGEDGWKEHGLGHLLNPTDPEWEDRSWMGQAWLNMIRQAFGLKADKTRFDTRPAVGRVSVSSPAVMKPLEALNKGKKYADQIKPFNFLLTCFTKRFGNPTDTDAQQFHLIAPYESNPSCWLQNLWIDQYTGTQYRITTAGFHGTRQTARVKTYGEILNEYEFHPESKCADADGNPCGKQTVGLLQRRHIRIDQIKYIGKESNNPEEVEAGLIQSEPNVYTEYPDSRRDEWQTKVVPAMRKPFLSTLRAETDLSRRALTKARSGKVRPHLRNQKTIVAALRKLGYL